MKILVTGDLHLGRRAASLPPERAEDPRFSTAAAWRQIVDAAVSERVEFLALTGDVVDRENRFYEAFGPLEEGLKRLAEAGIDTVAVAGNHDFDVLPRLAEQITSERFTLLGHGGAWERKVFAGTPDRPAVVFEGWSFPREHFPSNPLAARDLPRPDGPEAEGPVIALLHTELGTTGSRYAPVALSDLRVLPVTLCLLGHAHASYRAPGPGIEVIYPGSPMALDSREPGVHGPWLLTLEGRRMTEARPLPLSRVRYAQVELDLAGTARPEEVEQRRNEALRGELARAVEEGEGHLELLVARLRLAGPTALHRDRLARLFAEVEDLRLSQATATAVVSGVVDDTRPVIKLDDLAGNRDPAGALARTLLALQAGEDPEGLLADARDALYRVHTDARYSRLPDSDRPDTEAARGFLLAAGFRLLDALLEQKPASPRAGTASSSPAEGPREEWP